MVPIVCPASVALKIAVEVPNAIASAVIAARPALTQK